MDFRHFLFAVCWLWIAGSGLAQNSDPEWRHLKQTLKAGPGSSLGGLRSDHSGEAWIYGGFQQSLTSAGGTATITSRGDMDGFLARVSERGDVVQMIQFGGAGRDEASAVALSAEGLLVGGMLAGPAEIGGLPVETGGSHAFITLLDTAGMAAWVSLLPEPGVVLDLQSASGRLYASGHLEPAGEIAHRQGRLWGFGVEGEFRWQVEMRSEAHPVTLNGMLVDPGGFAYVGGTFQGRVIIESPHLGEAVILSSPLPSCGFVIKVDGEGHVAWFQKMPGPLEGLTGSVWGDLFAAIAEPAEPEPVVRVVWLEPATGARQELATLPGPVHQLRWSEGSLFAVAGRHSHVSPYAGVYLVNLFGGFQLLPAAGLGDFTPAASGRLLFHSHWTGQAIQGMSLPEDPGSIQFFLAEYSSLGPVLETESGPEPALLWGGPAGAYQLEFTQDLDQWEPWPEVETYEFNRSRVTLSLPQEALFFRLRRR